MHTNGRVRPTLAAVRDFRAGMRALERCLARSLGEQTTCCGVTLAQCHCLLEVEAREAPTVGELAKALEVDASTMSRNLDGLVDAAFVERVPNPRDRRSVIVRLAAAGRATVDEINRRNDAYFGRLLERMDARERRGALEGMAILARHMRALAEEEGGRYGR